MSVWLKTITHTIRTGKRRRRVATAHRRRATAYHADCAGFADGAKMKRWKVAGILLVCTMLAGCASSPADRAGAGSIVKPYGQIDIGVATFHHDGR
ncbi:MAG: hypothetical protein AB7S55_04240 [Thiomonas sp.]